jgi:hypothetical protein
LIALQAGMGNCSQSYAVLGRGMCYLGCLHPSRRLQMLLRWLPFKDEAALLYLGLHERLNVSRRM